jgi:hypothetical protein
MILLSEFMSKFAYLVGDKENGYLYSQQNIQMKANLHNLLFNEDTGLYTDYADMQWKAKPAENGQISEPVEWRDDKKCGKQYLSTLKFPARCNQPRVGDPSLDNARCCKNSICQVDPVCNCPGCI